MDLELADWRCRNCEMVSPGSKKGDEPGGSDEVPRQLCRYCQHPRPDLTTPGWRGVDGGFLEYLADDL